MGVYIRLSLLPIHIDALVLILISSNKNMTISKHILLLTCVYILYFTHQCNSQKAGRMVIRKDETVDKQARLEIIQAKQRAVELKRQKDLEEADRKKKEA